MSNALSSDILVFLLSLQSIHFSREDSLTANTQICVKARMLIPVRMEIGQWT